MGKTTRYTQYVSRLRGGTYNGTIQLNKMAGYYPSNIWYDVEDTLIVTEPVTLEVHLTQLGRILVETGTVIDIITFGGYSYSKKTLIKMGLNINQYVYLGQAIKSGLAKIDHNGNLSKNLPDDCLLVDDQPHLLTKNVITPEEMLSLILNRKEVK